MSRSGAMTDIPLKQSGGGVFQLFSPQEPSEHCFLRRLLMEDDEEDSQRDDNNQFFMSRRAPLEGLARPSVMKKLFEDPEGEEDEDSLNLNMSQSNSNDHHPQYAQTCFKEKPRKLNSQSSLSSSRNLFQAFQMVQNEQQSKEKTEEINQKDKFVLRQQQQPGSFTQQSESAQSSIKEIQFGSSSNQQQQQQKQISFDNKFFNQFQKCKTQEPLTRFKVSNPNETSNNSQGALAQSYNKENSQNSSGSSASSSSSTQSVTVQQQQASQSTSEQIQANYSKQSIIPSSSSQSKLPQKQLTLSQSSENQSITSQRVLQGNQFALQKQQPQTDLFQLQRAPPQSSQRQGYQTGFVPLKVFQPQQNIQQPPPLSLKQQQQTIVSNLLSTAPSSTTSATSSSSPPQLIFQLSTPGTTNNNNQSNQSKIQSSGKKSLRQKQNFYYEKSSILTEQNQPQSNDSSQEYSIPFATPVKYSDQIDNMHQYGFNSPLYTPGKLPKIKESLFEETPINEFKQFFSRKIKELRQQLKDNTECKTPESFLQSVPSSISSLPSSTNSKASNKENKQINNLLEILSMAVAKFNSFNPTSYWKIMLELADLAKKECMYHEAKYFYKIAISLQPFCPEIWLEYSKMEEDYGNLEKAKTILLDAYPFCKMSDNLILKLLRIMEKIGNIQEVRSLLANLSSVKLEKCWKIYMEGAQIEIRFGFLKNAERILKTLYNFLDLNGQVCYEYARLLELIGKSQKAMAVCWQAQENGVKCTTVWTLFLKLYEKSVDKLDAQVLTKFMRQATNCLPREIIWKINLEVAQICEKKNDFGLSKQYLITSIRSAQESMRWKPLIQAAKIELLQGNIRNSNLIIEKTFESCSEKQKPYLIIEIAKCAEIAGNFTSALSQIESLKPHMKNEWKIYMEYISMLVRNRNWRKAKQVVMEALSTHALAGRLWGELIQIEHILAKETKGNNLDSAFEYFLLALEEVPKSGEVWCEGARLCMNPVGNKFDLAKAKQFLEYAIFFTPQYGDSFVEALRLYQILGDREQIKQLKMKTITSQPNYGHLWYYLKDTTRDSSVDVWKNMKQAISDELKSTFHLYQKKLMMLDNTDINQGFMITALSSYNDLFYSQSTDKDMRWKLVFQLDQSLNQL